MVLYIKNMVCDRCITTVKNILEDAGLNIEKVELGEAVVSNISLSISEKKHLADRLHGSGFELIADRKSKIIEKIKNIIIDTVHRQDQSLKIKYSVLISEQLHYDYPYLSKLFSEVEGITIEQYIIRQKTERVKELLVYDELSLEEIALHVGYSSAAHLSNQFKKVTGLSPSHFKMIKNNKRKALDKLGEFT